MVTATRWQNRIISHGEAEPGELMAHPLNPKLHPINQELALDGIIESVGMIAPVIVNQRTGVIVDGHLRVKLALSRGEPSVPVTYVDLTDEQEAMALLTFDPIAAQAKVDAANLDVLLRQVETDNDALQQMLTQQAEAAGLYESRPAIDPQAEWQGMPAFEQNDLTPVRQIIVSFASADAVADFAQRLGLSLTDKARSTWYPGQEYQDNRTLTYTSDEESDES